MESSLGIKAYLNSITGPDMDLGKQCTYVELDLFQSRMRGHKRSLMRPLEVYVGTSNVVWNRFCHRSRAMLMMVYTR